MTFDHTATVRERLDATLSSGRAGATPEMERLYALRGEYQRGQISQRTEKDYSNAWRLFVAWCERVRLNPLPASSETLSLWLTDQLDRGLTVATAKTRACAVAFIHLSHGLEDPLTPLIKGMLKAVRRTRCERPRQMKPITIAQLREIAGQMLEDPTPTHIRNRALLVIAFTSALRRCNLSWMQLADVQVCPEGLVIQVKREKQDKQGKGRIIGLPFAKDETICPVRSFEKWLEIRGRKSGPLFTRLDTARSGDLEPLAMGAIWKIVKEAVQGIGLDSRLYGVHSLRSGFITAAGQAGANHLIIAKQSGHVSLETLQKYFRPVDLFRSNACDSLCL